MRVSSVGYIYNSIERTKHVATLTADITHDHPEGIKGAQATECTVFLACTGATKKK